MAVCARCGEDNPERAGFCLACGAPLPGDGNPRPRVRKTVTALFCDVSGSTELGERLDPEAVERVMSSYFSAARAAVERHGGTVEKFIGDAVMAVFGVPVVHEDDPLRAVRAAFDISTALRPLNEQLEQAFGVRIDVRIGLSTGQVLAADPTGDGTFVTGDAVNEAARLEQGAEPGEILMSLATYRLVRDAVVVEALEPLVLKGKASPVAAFRVVEVRPESPGHARHLDAPLVGRQAERQMLLGAFERALRERTCHLFTMLGAAGIGKTRLVAEVAKDLREQAVVLTSRCLPYGEGVAFRPLRDLVQQAARLNRADSAERARDKIARRVGGEDLAALIGERVAEVIGLTEATAPVEELFWGVRKLLEAVARSGPLVVVIDDVHWAAPSFLDLVEHVADWWQGSPLLLVCLARPELMDERPTWGGGRLNATSLLLEPLDRAQSDQLLANLVDGAAFDEAAAARIDDIAEGNPLFVEELVSMLIEDGLLRRVDGRWMATGELSEVPVPPSVESLLVARLDRLPPAEATVLERASIVGREFWPEALVALSTGTTRHDLQPPLVRLVNRRLIRFERSSMAGDEGFAFRHALLRDAAYRRISKRERSELHERFAAFLDGLAANRPGQYGEIAGHHLERAHRYRTELGLVDDHTERLGEAAAERLASAGRQALSRSDFRAASGLLSRARSLSARLDAAFVERLTALGQSLARVGDLAGAGATLDEAVQAATSLDDEGQKWHACLELARLRLWTDPDTGIELAGTTATEAIQAFRRLGDELGQAKASWVLAQERLFRCLGGESERLLREAVRHARAGGDRGLEVRILASFVSQVRVGPTPVAEAEAVCEALLQAAPASRTLDAAVLDGRAHSEAMQGRFEEARRLLEQEVAVLADIGDQLGVASAPLSFGEVEILARRWPAAEEHLRRACEGLESLGEKQLLSTAAAMLAHVLIAEGDVEGADRFSALSRQTAAAADIMAQVGWRGARAKVLARQGASGPAEQLATEAVHISEGTDFLNMRGDAHMDLAAVLQGARPGHDGAALAVRRALELYQAKGNLVSVRTAREVLAELVAPAARSIPTTS